jgi:UDP-N-acetylglucosamine 1-carboxyvinyltransferase
VKVKIRGKRSLQGTVEISGSKNTAVAIIPAAVLADTEVILKNVPNINDVQTLIIILEEIGYTVSFNENTLKLTPPAKIHYNIKTEAVKKLRGSYYFMGAFLSKIKKVRIKTSGGCDLGARPINFHLDAFQKLGSKITEESDEIFIAARKLKGSDIHLEFPSVGATINIMLAASKAKGVTRIFNSAIEPEIIEVGDFLISMGAKITGLGTKEIEITGVKKLTGSTFSIKSDRIEAGTYLILGAMSRGTGITVKNIDPEKLISLTNLLEGIGCDLNILENEITIKVENPLKPFHVTTSPYPGFPTDLGQLITTLMLTIDEESSLTETIFSNRFSHVAELQKMNANIKVVDNTIYASKSEKLTKALLIAHDLRCAAALILAATLSPGITTIDNIDVLLRGYEDPIGKLSDLGLSIELIN